MAAARIELVSGQYSLEDLEHYVQLLGFSKLDGMPEDEARHNMALSDSNTRDHIRLVRGLAKKYGADFLKTYLTRALRGSLEFGDGDMLGVPKDVYSHIQGELWSLQRCVPLNRPYKRAALEVILNAREFVDIRASVPVNYNTIQDMLDRAAGF